MSDSSIALKPVIEDPSKLIPPSKASSSCSAEIEKDFSCPRMSVNHRRMKRMLFSATSALTSSAVCGRSGIALQANGPRGRPGWTGGRKSVQPAVRPALELGHRRRELAPLGRELVRDLRRRALADVAHDDAARLELVHAPEKQAFRQVGDRVGDLREPHLAPVQQP